MKIVSTPIIFQYTMTGETGLLEMGPLEFVQIPFQSLVVFLTLCPKDMRIFHLQGFGSIRFQCGWDYVAQHSKTETQIKMEELTFVACCVIRRCYSFISTLAELMFGECLVMVSIQVSLIFHLKWCWGTWGTQSWRSLVFANAGSCWRPCRAVSGWQEKSVYQRKKKHIQKFKE